MPDFLQDIFIASIAIWNLITQFRLNAVKEEARRYKPPPRY